MWVMQLRHDRYLLKKQHLIRTQQDTIPLFPLSLFLSFSFSLFLFLSLSIHLCERVDSGGGESSIEYFDGDDSTHILGPEHSGSTPWPRERERKGEERERGERREKKKEEEDE